MTLNVKTFSIVSTFMMTLDIMTLSIMSTSTMAVVITTLGINDIQHRHSAKQYWVPLCWVSLCWVSQLLKCYAECRYSECRSSLNLFSHSDKRSSLFGDDDGKKVFRASANFFPPFFTGHFIESFIPGNGVYSFGACGNYSYPSLTTWSQVAL